jgi:hypothetical protein
MIRRILLAACLILAAAGGTYWAFLWETHSQSSTGCPMPHLLQNGTLADAGQVMDNFNTLSGCIANIASYDARSFGAKCDGVSDDSAVINTALINTKVVYIPPVSTGCAYGSTINVPADANIVGWGHNLSVLKALSTNLTGVSFTGSYSGMYGVTVNCGAPGTNSSGNCVNVAPGLREIRITNNGVLGPFVGIGTTTSVLVTIEDNYIYNPTITTGGCILVNGGNNQVLSNNFCQGIDSTHQPRDGIEILDTQGIWLSNNQSLNAGAGELIDPGTGQIVTWVFEERGSYDSGSMNGLSIAPTGTGSVRGYFCHQCWTSTNTLSGVAILGGGSTVIDDIHFEGHRSYNNQQHGVSVGAGATNVYLTAGSSICANSQAGAGSYNGVDIGVATHVTISGDRIGNCAGFGGPGGNQLHAINAGLGSNQLTFTGNDLTGNNNTPLNILFSNGTIATIGQNLGVDDQIPNVASATTVTLPPNPIIALTGNTSIQNMLGGWQGVQKTFIQGTNQTFVTGGTSGQDIATALTTTSPIPNTAYLAGPHWYIK